MKAIGYLRVSTGRQAEDGFGLDVQATQVRAYAGEHGLGRIRLIRDEGASGTLEERPGLMELDALLGPDVLVVVPRLDRLARDVALQEYLLRSWRKRGADVASCSEAEAANLTDDPDDPTRKLIRVVLGAVNDFEREMIRLRTRRGRAHKRAQGGYADGAPPYGSQAQDGDLTPVASEREAIDLAVKLRRNGGSLREICAALTDAGHEPRRGAVWHPTVVARILCREGVAA